MTEFCDQVPSTYLSTTAQHIKPLNRSLVQIYTLCGFSLSFFEIITQPWPVWHQGAATPSAGTEQTPEQPAVDLSLLRSHALDSAWGTRGQLQADTAGQQAGLPWSWCLCCFRAPGISTRTELSKIWWQTATRASTMVTPMSRLTDQPTLHVRLTPMEPFKEPASCTPLLSLGSYFNPPAPVSQPNIRLWSLDYVTGSVCKTSTNKFWRCPWFQTWLQ